MSSSSSLDCLELCRLCLEKERVSVPIFENEGDVRQIFLKITACLPVKVSRDDKLPKKICDDCLYKVELFYQFWNTTANAEKQLLQWLGEVGGLEDGVPEVLVSNVMKQEQASDNRLEGRVVQVGGQNSVDMGMIENMTIITMPVDGEQQFASVPMDTSGTVTVQAVASSSASANDQSQTSVSHLADEVEDDDDDDDDDGCDNEGMPVKEENEEDQSDRVLDQSSFVTIPCDEAGPSGLQQKIADISNMSLQPTEVNDPKTGLPLPLNRLIRSMKRKIQDNEDRDKQRPPKKRISTDSTPVPMVRIKLEEELMPLLVLNRKNDEDSNKSTESRSLPQNVFSCENCKAIFPQKHLLRKHDCETYLLKSTSSEKSESYDKSDRIQYKGHQKVISTGKFICDYCPMIMSNQSSIRQHISRKHNDNTKKKKVSKPIETSDEEEEEEEPMSDDDKIKYRGHHKIISTDEYVCDYCPLVLSHQASMRKHISRKHGDLHAETMKNDTASKLSDSISESDSSDTEDNPKIKSERVDFKGFYKIVKTGEFHCNYCIFKISNKSSIRSHVVRKHKELLESGFASNEADESVQKNDSHCVSSDPEDDSRIEGDRIDFKGFHQMTKTGEFGCNFCPFTISNKSSIRSHVVRKHKELLERELASKKADESDQKDDSNDQLKQECSSDDKTEDALPHELLKVVLKEGKSKVKLSPVDIVRRFFRKSSSQSVYRCPTCPYKSRKRSNFRDHLRRQHPTIWSNFRKPKIVDHPMQLKHKCLYCPIEYFSRASLRSHVARVHRKGENREDAVVSPGLSQALTGYACYLCDFIGSSLPSLKRHVNRVHEDSDMYHGQIPATSFDCDACNFQCENRKEMKDHIEGHKPKPSIDGRYKCTDCDFDANLPGIVQLHMSVTHLPPKITKIPDHVNCDRCDFTCINKRVMEWHREQHDLPPERARQILTCHECGFFSWNKTLLRRHILKKHEEPTEGCEVYMGLKSERRRKEPVHVPIPCSHCSYIAKNKTTLDFHVIRKHTGSLEHECEHCGKKFKLNHDLTRHVKVKHLDTKIYICDVCGQVYNTSNGLYTHQRYAHFKREFACHLCPKRLANQANLDEHILKQHEQRQDFICEECGKIFKESRTLKAHLRIHTGYKPYVCKVCNKSFGKGSGLRQHMLIHSDQRLYICDICGKSYAQKTGLICHRKSHPGPLPPLPALPRVAVDRVLSRLLHGRE